MRNKILLFSIIIIYINLISNDKILRLIKAKNTDYTIKSEFLLEMKRLFNTSIFIETGSNKGDTVACASKIFTKVYSIELMAPLYNNLLSRFKNINNVHLYNADSTQALSLILPDVKDKILFWLDAHYCGDSTGMSDYVKTKTQTPILQEIETIAKFQLIDPVIMIDDVRFCNDPYWPSINEIEQKIIKFFPDYEFVIFGDIAISFSKKEKVKISSLLKSITISRLFDEQGSKKYVNVEKVLEAETAIGYCDESECEALFYTCTSFPDWSSQCHLNLWMGLIHYNKGNFKEAFENFKKIDSHPVSIKNWRKYLYLAKAAKKLSEDEILKNITRKVIKKLNHNNDIKLYLRGIADI